jgi:hypothetical protein
MAQEFVTEWNGFKVGDIIKAYHTGYHSLIAIQRRYLTQVDLGYSVYSNRKVGDEISAIFVYTKVANAAGETSNKISKRTESCDASFCEHADKHIEKEIQKLKKMTETLEMFKAMVLSLKD